MLPGTNVWQFSYAGPGCQGAAGPAAGRPPTTCRCPALGDRIAAQVRALHAAYGAAGRRGRGERGNARRLRDARPRPDAAGRRRGAAQPDRQPGPAQLPAGPGRRLGLRGRPRRAEPPGRRHVAVRPERRAAAARLGQRGTAPGTSTTCSPRAHRRVRWLAVVPLADAVTLPGCAPAVRRDRGPRPARRPARRPDGAPDGPCLRVRPASHEHGRRPAPRGGGADHRRGRRLADAGHRRRLPVPRPVTGRRSRARRPAVPRRPGKCCVAAVRGCYRWPR